MTDMNLPYSSGISLIFDYNDCTISSWVDQLSGVSMEIYSPTLTKDYVSFTGSNTSYAKLTYGGTSGGNASNSDYCIRYVVLKNLSGVYADWKTIVGNETGTYYCSTITMNSSGQLRFTRNNITQSKYYINDWHVICWTSNKSSGQSALFIDGEKIGTASGCSGWAADTYFCRGPSWQYSNNDTAFKCFIVGDTIPTDSEIIANSKYLYQKYLTLWHIIDGELTNSEFISEPEKVISKPYPAGMWRISSFIENGTPYHLLLPDLEQQDPVKTFQGLTVYSVTADDELIFKTDYPGNDYQLINPTLTFEDSQAGTFEFTMPPNHPKYNDLKRMKTVIKIFKNEEEYFEGRILTEDVDFFNQRAIYCEGELAYLNDTRQPQREYSHQTAPVILGQILQIHNSKVDSSKMFTLGYCPAEFPTEDEYYYTQFQTTLSVFKDIAEKLGCHIRVFKDNGVRKIELFKDINTTSKQKIVFGENLQDFTRSYDMSNVVTALLPLGKVTTGEKKQIGEEITPGANYTVTSGEAIVEYDYEEEGVQKTTVTAITTYPGTDTPLPLTFKTGWLTVNAGEKYYVTSRLPNGYGFLFYALKFPDGYRIYDVKTSGSGVGYTDITQVAVDIPEGVSQLVVGGDTEFVPMVINRSEDLPDDLDSYVTVESVNNGDMYVKAEPREVITYDEFGHATTVTIDPMEEWGYIEKTLEMDDIEDPQTLLDKATAYLRDYQFDEMTIEIEAIDAVNLGVDTNSIEMYQNVRVQSPIHGLDRTFPVTKMKVVLNDPTQNTLTLNSKTETNLTATTNAMDEEVFAKLSAITSPSTILNAAKNSAMELIKSGTNGIVSLNVDENTGYVNSITISSEADWQSSDNYWIWNQGGLAFVRDGEQLVAAITNDGHIVADFITAGTMFADRIKGGTLTLGAYGDQSAEGKIIVRDSNGKTVFSANKDAVTVTTSNGNHYMEMYDAKISAGTLDTNGDKIEYGKIELSVMYEGGVPGLCITGDAIELNPNQLLIADINNNHIPTQARTTTVNVATGDGSVIPLQFINGILI